jgi:hypothetical protein
MSNKAFPDLYKVGFTKKHPETRRRELSNRTCCPYDFEICFAKNVEDCVKSEKLLHTVIAKYGERVNPNREFFKIPLESIELCFEMIEGEWYDFIIPSNDNESECDEDPSSISVSKEEFMEWFNANYEITDKLSDFIPCSEIIYHFYEDNDGYLTRRGFGSYMKKELNVHSIVKTVNSKSGRYYVKLKRKTNVDATEESVSEEL